LVGAKVLDIFSMAGRYNKPVQYRRESAHKSRAEQLLLGYQTGRLPAPTLLWGQWAFLRYKSFAGGRGSCGFQEHICDVNSSACCAYVSSFYTFRVSLLPTATFSTSAIFVYIFIHPRLHSSVDAQLHFRGHFRVHSCTSMPTFICGRTVMSLFYAYTHLWVYSGLYSARRL
jgi:hypothetical protein